MRRPGKGTLSASADARPRGEDPEDGLLDCAGRAKENYLLAQAVRQEGDPEAVSSMMIHQYVSPKMRWISLMASAKCKAMAW